MKNMNSSSHQYQIRYTKLENAWDAFDYCSYNLWAIQLVETCLNAIYAKAGKRRIKFFEEQIVVQCSLRDYPNHKQRIPKNLNIRQETRWNFHALKKSKEYANLLDRPNTSRQVLEQRPTEIDVTETLMSKSKSPWGFFLESLLVLKSLGNPPKIRHTL